MNPGDRQERIMPRWLAVAHHVVSAFVLLTLIAAVVTLVVSLYFGADAKYQQMILFKDKIADSASGR